MRSSIATLALIMAVAHRAMAFTYYIDSTCYENEKSGDTFVQETKDMASSAVTRLKSASDTDFQKIWEYIMKREKNTQDPTFVKIRDFMQDVSQMTQAGDRNSANVRIYCDEEEKRWVKRKDPVTNTELGGWEDRDNWMHYPHRVAPGCLYTSFGTKKTPGETFATHLEGESPQKQADVRATISLCNLIFFKDDGTPKKAKFFKHYRPQTNLALPIDKFFMFHASKVLLHELSHTAPYSTVDHEGTYNWFYNPFGPKVTQDLTAAELENHADVRALLGQFALLADRGYTLPRTPILDGLNEQERKKKQDDYSDAWKRGQLQKLDNVTKRSLQRRRARFARRYAKTGP